MMAKSWILILIGSLWLNPCVVSAQRQPVTDQQAGTDNAAIRTVLESAVTKYCEKHQQSAIAIGVLHRGQQLIACQGDAREGVPATADTLFEIGSITKAFTGTLLARLVNDGRVKLDDPANTHLPKTLQVPDHKGQPISLLDLATHRSSLPVQPPDVVLHALFSGTANNPYSKYTTVQLEKMLSKLKLVEAPNTKYTYSNLGAGLLGHAIIHSTGDEYETIVGTLLLKPLKMTSTVIDMKPNGLEKRLAVPHLENGTVVSVWDFACLQGCGALRSSVNDMLKFARACLDAKDSSDDPVIRALAFAMSARRDVNRATRIGLLWHRTKTGFGEMIWHNGGTGGSRSFLGINPATHQAVIVLTNCGDSVDKLAVDLLTELAGQSKAESGSAAPDQAR